MGLLPVGAEKELLHDPLLVPADTAGDHGNRSDDGQLLPRPVAQPIPGHDVIALSAPAKAVSEDVERKRAEQALLRQQDLYAVLSLTNQAIVRSQSAEDLFKRVCRIAVEHGKLHCASVSILSGAKRRLRMVAQFGGNAGCEKQVALLREAAVAEGGLLRRALLSGEREIYNDFLADPATAPWQAAARNVGIAASAAFPLHRRGEVIGTFNLCASEAGFFTPELVPTLEDVAADLSFALDAYAADAERREAEQTEAESRRRYQELVEESRDGIYARAPNGRFQFVNAAFCQMLGYEREALLQMSIHDLLDKDDRHVDKVMVMLAAGTSIPPFLTSHLRHRVGYWVPVEAASKRRPDGTVQVTVRDLSARMESEERLAEAQQFAVDSTNTIPGIFYVFDQRGRLLHWNSRSEEILGYASEEIKNKRILDFVAPEHRIPVREQVNEAIRSGEAAAEGDLLTRSGRRIPYYFTVRRFRWQGRTCIAGTGIDITDRRHAERLLQDYVDQVRMLSRKLLAAQEQERRAIARELHDEVGSALTALQMSLSHCEKHAPEDLKPSLHDGRDMAAMLLGQIRKMSLDLRPSVLDDLGLAAAVNWFVRERLRKSGLEVRLEISPEIGRLPTEIESTCFRVLQGAATNALRHAGARILEIELSCSNESLELLVRDNGRGFDVAAARARAMEGTSMGLLAMEERVHLTGGKFTLRSEPGHGTEIRVLFKLPPEVAGGGERRHAEAG